MANCITAREFACVRKVYDEIINIKYLIIINITFKN